MKNNSKFNRGFIVSLAVLSMIFLSSAKFAKADTFTSDLSVGSSGPSVVALQTWLINNDYLVMPSGVSTGYFGQLTKAALIKYQLSQGITPAVGYFGPITRAKMSSAPVVMNPAPTNNQPIISITPTSGPVGTPVTVSVTNSVPVVNGNLYLGGSLIQGTNGQISVNGTQFIFTIPQKIYSGCPVVSPQSNLAVDCDPPLTPLQSGVYQVYVQMDSTTTNSVGTIISGPSTVSNKVSFTVTPPTTIQTPITVISPSVGAIWKYGATETISWSANNSIQGYDIDLVSPPCTSIACPAVELVPIPLAKDIAGNSYGWQVVSQVTNVVSGSNVTGNFEVPAGTYSIAVCQTGSDTCGYSSSFTISN